MARQDLGNRVSSVTDSYEQALNQVVLVIVHDLNEKAAERSVSKQGQLQSRLYS